MATVLGVLVVAAGISLGSPSAPAGPASRPNILFVLTDDMAKSELAVMPHVRSLLAEQGTSFSKAFVSVSLCCPSRTTILRGQYSHNTGIETNGGENGGFETAYVKGVESSTIATWLHADGYRTALFGKYLNGYPNGASDSYVPPGWDEFDSPTRGGNPYRQYRLQPQRERSHRALRFIAARLRHRCVQPPRDGLHHARGAREPAVLRVPLAVRAAQSGDATAG